MDWVFFIVGAALVLFCFVQLLFWTSTNIRRHVGERGYWQLQRQLLIAKIEATEAQRKSAQNSGVDNSGKSEVESQNSAAWRGWRKFRVKRLHRETSNATSVYLVPQDGLELPEFKPGQFLTLRFELPNQTSPLIRCYSLSDGARAASHYRITVKDVHGKPLSQGGVSHFVNWQWSVGDTIEVKAPGGDFFLDVSKKEPVILLAGGVGITPMMSMIETVLQRGDRRDLLLFYGLRHGGDHIFKDRLRELSKQHSNFNVLNCYSEPEKGDVEGRDFHFQGRVSVELIKRALPSPNFHFYMCGPGPFMSSLFEQLIGWGVPEDQIHFEAFGPATVKGASTGSQSVAVPATTDNGVKCNVHFARSKKVIEWNDGDKTLLDAANGNGVPISSGCRAGQCGSCQTKLLRGEVMYPNGQPHDVEAGHCLPCVAIPKLKSGSNGEVVLDA
ncbi:MAG: 2Fe-2S iron-sulfur cluster binding domain-containing protein [Planctomycetaceae bacterium]|nr:2Fe-2S iron-sulfur cluster binding domain-containing protein [Planctomycetaceae bacterium]